MAFKRTLAQRLFNISSKSNTTLTNCRISSPSSAVRTFNPPSPTTVAPEPRDDVVFRRVLQWRQIYQSAALAPELRPLPRGEELVEKMRGMDIYKDRIRLDGLCPPAVNSPKTTTVTEEEEFTAKDARKLLRASQLEMVKSKLRQIKREHISVAELVEICSEGCSNDEQGLQFAKALDDSGTVIVLGNVVFLRPDKVVKVMQGLMPAPLSQPSKQYKDLEEMESRKAAIDRRADFLVRRELWFGLSYLVLQTAAFIRLTFWELSWDVMEPICFYVTSMYIMAGYAFFMTTSKEPSFEGFYESRFNSKQNRLMKKLNFDVRRYNELRRACYPPPSTPGHASSDTTPSSNNFQRIHVDALR